MSAPQIQPTTPRGDESQYPGGEEAIGYRRAFSVWIVLFLLLIVVALLNYFGLLLIR